MVEEHVRKWRLIAPPSVQGDALKRLNPPALEAFWEQADVDGSNEHPLEREIAEQQDALLRYGGLIEDAQAQGRDDLADLLIGQQERHARVLRQLREALRRMKEVD